MSVRTMLRLAAVMVAVAALGLGRMEAGGPGSGNAGGNGGAKVEGKVTAVVVDNGLVTITPRNGKAVNLSVTATTKIERNGRHVALSAIKVGDRGEARFDPKTGVASKIEAIGP